VVLCGHDDVARALFRALLRSAVHKKSIKRVYFAGVCQHHFAYQEFYFSVENKEKRSFVRKT